MIKWDDTAIKAAMEGKVNQFLQAAGQHAVNQMQAYAHVKTGALRNSINYKLNPGKDTVDVGTNIIYAGPQEKHNAFASKTYDKLATDGQLLNIAERVFKIG
jgi:hypothetical protein